VPTMSKPKKLYMGTIHTLHMPDLCYALLCLSLSNSSRSPPGAPGTASGALACVQDVSQVDCLISCCILGYNVQKQIC
jgi:hypothetical protein